MYVTFYLFVGLVDGDDADIDWVTFSKVYSQRFINFHRISCARQDRADCRYAGVILHRFGTLHDSTVIRQ